MVGAPMHQTLLEAALSGDITSLPELSDEALDGVAAGGNTAAHVASKLGHSEFLTEILRRCPDLLERRNSYQDTALHCAARVGNNACIRVLLEAWRTRRRTAPVSASNDAAGLTASETRPVEGMGDEKDPPAEKVDVAGENSASGKSEARVDGIPKWVNKRGNTALHEAVRKQRVAVVDTLLEADPSLAMVTNNNGESALGIAHRISSSEIVEILLKYQTGSSSNLEGKSGANAAAYRDNGSDARHSKSLDRATTKKQRRKQNGGNHQSSIVINKMILTSVLIATLTFAAAIALPVGSGDEEGEGTAFMKQLAFLAFLLSDGVAMVSSVIIILLLVQMGSLDHSSLLHTMNTSLKIVRVAVGGMAAAFGFGAYVAITFEDEWQAAIFCITSAAVPFVIYVVTWWPTI